MLNYILYIIGFILIGFSIIVIRKEHKKVKNKIECNREEYYKHTEEIKDTFDEVMDSKIEFTNNENRSRNSKNNVETFENRFLITEDNQSNSKIMDSTEKKILELQSIGLSIEEIAKILNKGVRELEIIMKLYEIKNKDKNK